MINPDSESMNSKNNRRLDKVEVKFGVCLESEMEFVWCNGHNAIRLNDSVFLVIYPVYSYMSINFHVLSLVFFNF